MSPLERDLERPEMGKAAFTRCENAAMDSCGRRCKAVVAVVGGAETAVAVGSKVPVLDFLRREPSSRPEGGFWPSLKARRRVKARGVSSDRFEVFVLFWACERRETLDFGIGLVGKALAKLVGGRL